MSDRKVALVTGGSQGIGRAVALKLAQEGCDVAILYASAESEADETKALIEGAGMRALALRCDVSDPAQAADAVAQVRGALGPIGILVNNAGITRDNLSLRMSDADWQRVLDVNLSGAFYMMRACMPDFVRRRAGRIINISSISALMGNVGQANYAAAKAGMIALTKSVARELAQRGVTVNAVAPGFIRTRMTDAMNESTLEAALSHVPMERIGAPEDIANAVAFLAGDGAGYITGAVLQVDGGMYM